MTEFFNRSSEKDLRRRLRTDMPPAEVILWSRLRRGPLRGHRFRRQYSVGPFCIDFDCAQSKLATELDGDSHFTPEAKSYDAQRQHYIESFGIRLLRFTNVAVMTISTGWLRPEPGHWKQNPPVSPLRKGGRESGFHRQGKGGPGSRTAGGVHGAEGRAGSIVGGRDGGPPSPEGNGTGSARHSG
jgi:very-short-patch-repair endonuclease